MLLFVEYVEPLNGFRTKLNIFSFINTKVNFVNNDTRKLKTLKTIFSLFTYSVCDEEVKKILKILEFNLSRINPLVSWYFLWNFQPSLFLFILYIVVALISGINTGGYRKWGKSIQVPVRVPMRDCTNALSSRNAARPNIKLPLTHTRVGESFRAFASTDFIHHRVCCTWTPSTYSPATSSTYILPAIGYIGASSSPNGSLYTRPFNAATHLKPMYRYTHHVYPLTYISITTGDTRST